MSGAGDWGTIKGLMRYLKDTPGQRHFNEKEDLSGMCIGCHPYQPHPGGTFSVSGKGPPNHLVKPNERFVTHMEKMAKKNGIVLPLTPGSGKIFCGTCHNPHQKGTIPLERAGAKGAGEHYRHRLPGNICMKCHQM